MFFLFFVYVYIYIYFFFILSQQIWVGGCVRGVIELEQVFAPEVDRSS